MPIFILKVLSGNSRDITITNELDSKAAKSLQSIGWLHKTDFKTLKCPGCYYTPHRNGLSAQHQTFSVPRAHRNNDHHPTKPPNQHQSTHQQSLPALTTSSPLNEIRPGLEAASAKYSLFRKNTLAAIFFLTGCVLISDFAARSYFIIVESFTTVDFFFFCMQIATLYCSFKGKATDCVLFAFEIHFEKHFSKAFLIKEMIKICMWLVKMLVLFSCQRNENQNQLYYIFFNEKCFTYTPHNTHTHTHNIVKTFMMWSYDKTSKLENIEEISLLFYCYTS